MVLPASRFILGLSRLPYFSLIHDTFFKNFWRSTLRIYWNWLFLQNKIAPACVTLHKSIMQSKYKIYVSWFLTDIFKKDFRGEASIVFIYPNFPSSTNLNMELIQIWMNVYLRWRNFWKAEIIEWIRKRS